MRRFGDREAGIEYVLPTQFPDKDFMNLLSVPGASAKEDVLYIGLNPVPCDFRTAPIVADGFSPASVVVAVALNIAPTV